MSLGHRAGSAVCEYVVVSASWQAVGAARKSRDEIRLGIFQLHGGKCMLEIAWRKMMYGGIFLWGMGETDQVVKG